MKKINREEIITNHVAKTGIIERLKKAAAKGNYLEIDITPDEALDILTANDIGQNRNVKEKTVALYKSEMLGKNWRSNGDSVRFSKSFKLLDGQHRLWAQWEAKATLKWLFVFNLPEDTFSFIDSGAPRDAADIVSIGGYKTNQKILGYAVKNILFFKKYSKLGAAISKNVITNQAVQKFVRNKEWMRDLTNFVGKAEHELMTECKYFTKPQWATLIFILHDLDWQSDESRKKVLTFVKKLAKGSELSEIDPIYKLRKMLENFDEMALKKKRLKVANNIFLAKAKYFFCAWDKYITGERGPGDLEPDLNVEEIPRPKVSKYN